ncbi:DUF4184 family protein [Streptomyces sp. H27-D2]|uniref:DUF4184 family protein n=1 Tax=Streptomyces sp. H27-D2 TaxID=3046304 RepID=UPI002DBE507E|nr:DUF4184 family protein [Streptomyces sp. H27-D2]MEC4019736.1 DUF4184 family protein [Streptomyces sp. H27-D2]
MPFTLSHAAAVLPGIHRNGTARGGLVAAALVAGSFAPDLTYFADTVLPGAMRFGNFTHSPAGVLSVDALSTAALLAGWLLLREPLVALLPRARQGRAYALLRGRPWRGRRPVPLAAAFYLSAVLGSTTHIVWDAFTHSGRWGARLLPVLGESVAGFPVTMYVQYGSSAIALALIVAFTASALRRLPDASPPARVPVLTARGRLLAAGLLAVCVLLGAAHRCLRFGAGPGADATLFDFVPTALFGAGAGLALGLPLYAAAARIRHRARPTPPAERNAVGGNAAGRNAVEPGPAEQNPNQQPPQDNRAEQPETSVSG